MPETSDENAQTLLQQYQRDEKNLETQIQHVSKTLKEYSENDDEYPAINTGKSNCERAFLYMLHGMQSATNKNKETLRTIYQTNLTFLRTCLEKNKRIQSLLNVWLTTPRSRRTNSLYKTIIQLNLEIQELENKGVHLVQKAERTIKRLNQKSSILMKSWNLLNRKTAKSPLL
jgi:hypothetical protein